MTSTLSKRWNSYVEPIEPLRYAAWALKAVVFEAIRTQGIGAVLAFACLRDQAFALWYRTISPYFLRFEETTAIPQLLSQAHGTILELGPGLGNQLPRFDQSKVRHIYGVESNSFFRADLEAKIEETGLQGRYTLITSGVEDSDVLERHGVTDGSLDTIVSIQVLCSTPKPEAVARGLYKLLKPGGKFIFWEHHQSHDFVTRIVQSFWNPAWRFGVGGCSMNRNMLHILKEAGEWENFDTTLKGDEEPWSMLPRIWGELIKSGDAEI
ncbi:S-adenosyl-L-methionine-dependent methyltransferase [Rhypophila sp. PSN 637]